MIRSLLLLGLYSAVAGLAFSQAPSDSKTKSADDGKDLTAYIQQAKQLGLPEDQVRQNAIKAGFKPNLVDEALKSPASIKPPQAPNAPERPNRGVPDEYVIGEADILQVAVWMQPDASVASVTVRADGKVTLPFIKDVVVSGMTPLQAEAVITEKLKPYYTNADVTVVVREVHSKRIYLVGAVRRQGVMELKYPMTVLQAITESGGPSEFAKRKKMYVLHTENGKQFKFDFNYDEVIQGKNPEQNRWLSAGDYIYIPQ